MILERELIVRSGVDEVYEFHLLPDNLIRLMPPEMDVRISNTEEKVIPGSLVKITMMIMGQRKKWFSRFVDVQKNQTIVDTMEDGPLNSWRHTRSFESIPTGTIIRDKIEYTLTLGPLGYLANNLFAIPIIERIFYYKTIKLREIFGWVESDTPKLRGIPLTFSIRRGNLVQILAILGSLLILPMLGSHVILNLILMIFSWLILFYFTHGISHYLVGKMLGIGFKEYFIGISNLVRLDIPLIRNVAPLIVTIGIRTEKESMRSTSRYRKAWMFRSGALSSMFSPFLVPVYATILGLYIEAILLYSLSAGNVLFTLYFSPRAGDLWKAKNTLRPNNLN